MDRFRGIRLVQLSVIIPALNAVETIVRTLDGLTLSPIVVQRIVVDGGSHDETVSVARNAGAKIVRSPKGRGTQMAAGAADAMGDWLLFLHSDTVLNPEWSDEASRFIERSGADCAAVFRFALDDQSAASARLEAMVAWRCRVLSLPYGDQGLLISRRFYDALGGYKPVPLFEDVDIIRRIGRDRLVLLDSRAVTSAARYRASGYCLRSLRNLFCLGLYCLGIPPHVIVRFYG